VKLTNEQRKVLQLVLRSPDRGEGWRTCSQAAFDNLVMPMPDELFEKDAEQRRVRLTEKGNAIAEWM